jgi:hypothetical protein
LSEHIEASDRAVSGRFARNLALSISGGALATLFGATAAHAQDVGAAQAESTGTGTVGTGDATAVGNQSTTNTTQTITVSGNLGVIQVINQQANVSNIGSATANTGGNIAIGNQSNNTATGDQTAEGTGTDNGAANNGGALNESDGTASVTTGAASAIGNQSTTNVVQEAKGTAHGQLGGILVINQEANVINAGAALANTGGNGAVGNDSTNDSGLLQHASGVDGSLATNNGTAANNSNGKATINTGAASAIGNDSVTNVTQKASGDAGGDLGGLMIVNQDVNVLNAGGALANTGGNVGVGNTSDNEAHVGLPGDPQHAGVVGLDDIGIASNNGEASNTSGGSASITTGAATAVGNKATTNVTQTATGKIIGGGGFGYVDQDSEVVNYGEAYANSGFNYAFGNTSDGYAETLQSADAQGFTDVGVVGQFGLAANDSDGTGTINSGVANAAGNQTTTNVGQTADIQGGALQLQFQDNDVFNVGFGTANTGQNVGVGNASHGEAFVDQDAVLDPTLPVPPADGIDVAVVGQFGKAANASDGTATINTGAATAVGNQSSTDITQWADPTASTIQIQNAEVVNYGEAFANSGGNLAIGNASDSIGITGAGGDALLEAQDALADYDELISGNVGIVLDQLLGDLDPEPILPGDFFDDYDDDLAELVPEDFGADLGDQIDRAQLALANVYETLGTGGLGAFVPADGLPEDVEFPPDVIGGLTDYTTVVRDRFRPQPQPPAEVPEEEAAVGIEADDTTDVGQSATVGAADLDAENVILANDGEASNASDGTATIGTGVANANGNISTTKVGQKTIAGGDGSGIALSIQDADVLNAGGSVANTGINDARGNTSSGDAGLDQDAAVDAGTLEATDALTVSNNGVASNTSDGTAAITTGAATSTGNRSSTDVAQDTAADIDGSGLSLARQSAVIVNAGVGIADTGQNEAVGNDATGSAGGGQGVTVGDGALSDLTTGTLTIASNTEASNTSDGTATIKTGAADATGNTSTTDIDQTSTADVDGSGLLLSPQTAIVSNGGFALANTGDNRAVGNSSYGQTGAGQSAGITGDGSLTVEDLSIVNSAKASNTSDGTATITTGAAKAEGSNAKTTIGQDLAGSTAKDGAGFALQRQTAEVDNSGTGIANTGGNQAIGNDSSSQAGAASETTIGGFDDSGAIDGGNVVDTFTIAGNAQAANTTDGTATITTGAALGRGNVSTTDIGQEADATIGEDGFGALPAFQTAGVVNGGVGIGNSGVNLAIGNDSGESVNGLNTAAVEQFTAVDWTGDATLGTATFASTATAANTSDGTATITTGAAEGAGNNSATTIDQDVEGTSGEFGFALQRQEAGVLNFGVGIGNSGVNGAVGNASHADAGAFQNTDFSVVDGVDPADLTVETFTTAQVGNALNDSDGTATITTGAATGRGTVSSTDIGQTGTASVGEDDSFGTVIAPQTAVVTNTGTGIGNSGVNGAVGNLSGALVGEPNSAGVNQGTNVGTDTNVLTADLFTLANTATASNESNGTATIGTGAAIGVGNDSDTTIDQALDSDAGDFGFIITGQEADVVNDGFGLGESGVNGAVGNASGSFASAEQDATFATTDPVTLTGPGTVAQTGHAANESNGTGKVTTGAATGTGNLSATDIDQDLDLDVEDGFSIVRLGQGVVNHGDGFANSGRNAAIGNLSGNEATSDQTVTLDDPTTAEIETQTLTNGGGAENNSTGAGEVRSGVAKATGNDSDTTTGQKATVDGPGAIANITAATLNDGTARANSGRNLGLGNASTNVADLTQAATGAGIVSNNGVAGNGATDPDGGPTTPTTPTGPGTTPTTPTTPTDPGTTPPTTTPTGTDPGTNPGRTSLPKTGSELEAEALIGAMLLLAGFGFRRAGKRLS